MKIIHLIPEDALGGVEQAARSLQPSKELDIEVAFLRGTPFSNDDIFKEVSGPNVKLNSLQFYINGFNYLLQKKPEVIISSLWRSSIISLTYVLYRKIILRENIKFIIFLHANEFAHVVDRLVTSISFYLSDEIWCDSLATKNNLLKKERFINKSKVISFFTKVKHNHPKNIERTNNFVFWGRLAKQKRVDKAIKLFYRINKKAPDSLFYIYGPDRGELKDLKKLVEKLNLADKILFMGDKSPDDYPEEALSSKFFINTSTHEGMAIAITEAMQIGLVPIVTPVGEIANYCKDSYNSIYYDEEESTAGKVLELLSDLKLYSELSKNAISFWASKLDYSTDFKQNCSRVIMDISKNAKKNF